jgi:ubiquinone/menaquinone biosynthesis C-methylase UbiE
MWSGTDIHRSDCLADESNGQLVKPVLGPDENVKNRAQLCESDVANPLLGTSFLPGGLKLTKRLGTLLQLTSKSRVLDVASGKGTSAIFLAKYFRCQVVGLDCSSQNVTEATELAGANGLSSRVRFNCGDGERLPFPNASFDAVICEGAFCACPDKSNTARELARVLWTGGRLGLSDFTRREMLSQKLDCLFPLIACLADAQPIASYVEYLRAANFDVEKLEFHDAALTKLVRQIRIKLSRAKNLAAQEKLLSGVDLTSIKQMAAKVLTAVQQGQLGYIVLVAFKSSFRYKG